MSMPSRSVNSCFTFERDSSYSSVCLVITLMGPWEALQDDTQEVETSGRFCPLQAGGAGQHRKVADCEAEQVALPQQSLQCSRRRMRFCASFAHHRG